MLSSAALCVALAAAARLLSHPALPSTPPPLVRQQRCAHPRLAVEEPAAPPVLPEELAERYRPAEIDESTLSIGQVVECTVLGKLSPKTSGSKSRRELCGVYCILYPIINIYI